MGSIRRGQKTIAEYEWILSLPKAEINRSDVTTQVDTETNSFPPHCGIAVVHRLFYFQAHNALAMR